MQLADSGAGGMGMSGEEIYRNFTEAVGGGDLAAAADMVKQLQGSYEEGARSVRALAVRMESAWQGDAGGAAQRGAVPLAAEQELSAPQLFTAQDLTGRQVGSFDSAKSAAVPVPPAPDRPSGWEVVTSPTVLPTFEQKLAEHNAAGQHNVDVMTSYEGASSYNGDNLPASYGSITPDSAGLGIQQPDARPEPGPVVEWRDTRNPGGGPGKESVTGPRPGGQPGPAAGGPGPVPAGGPGGAPPQATTPGGFTPAPSAPGTGGQPVVGGPGVGLPTPGGPGSGASPGFGPVAGLGSDAGVRGLGGGPEPGAGGRGGPVGPRGPGAAGRGPGEAGRGPGARMGAGPLAGGAAAEAAAARGGPGRGGAAGGLPFGAAPGRGEGDEDREYPWAPYLQEDDPEGLFGTDEFTAPPVIGLDD